MGELKPLSPPSNQFQWHKDALAGKKPVIDPEKPQTGYYRRPLPGGTFQRVVIFMDGPDLVATADGERVDPRAIWPHAALNPCRYEDHDFFVREGRWPDQPKPIGHNQGPPLDDDDADKYGAAFAALFKENPPFLAEAAKALSQPDKTDADAISLLVDKLGALATRADKEHGTEKRPWIDGGNRIDERWRKLRDVPRAAALQLKRVILLPAAVKRAAEVQRKAAEAKLAQQAAGAPTPVVAAPEKVTVGQGTGARKKALKEVRIAVIVDQDALYQALRNDPLIVETLQLLASKVIKVGGTLPGVEVRKEQRV